MTTTRRSNFAAGLRTTILMAALGGLLVVIGYAIGGVGGATGFLAIALLLNFVFYWFSDRIALASARREADLGVGGASALPDGPRAHALAPTCPCRSST